MKLSSLNKITIFLLFFLCVGPMNAEEETVDIWKKGAQNENINDIKEKEKIIQSSSISNSTDKSSIGIIEEENAEEQNNLLLYGIWDPDKYNFELSMWSKTDGKNLEKIIKRINKLNLSTTAENRSRNI